MLLEPSPSIAILLATHNSASFIEQQILSLLGNKSRFTLHWLDDQSSDDTRARVHGLAARLEIELVAWHQPKRLGVPGAFFRLLECVSADFYFFCDHDDIWQAGKIDAAVTELLTCASQPALCYSEPLVFTGSDQQSARRYYSIRGVTAAAVQMHSRAFALNPAVGNTVAFTRQLRELFLSHDEIARSHAIMHDWWMYLLALSTGVPRMLDNVPTTFYRQHRNNAVGIAFRGKMPTLSTVWWRLQNNRQLIARQAAGFILATARMKSTPAIDQLRATAQLIQTIDRRQTVCQIFTLLRRRALQVPLRRAVLLGVVCLVSSATRTCPA